MRLISVLFVCLYLYLGLPTISLSKRGASNTICGTGFGLSSPEGLLSIGYDSNLIG